MSFQDFGGRGGGGGGTTRTPQRRGYGQYGGAGGGGGGGGYASGGYASGGGGSAYRSGYSSAPSSGNRGAGGGGAFSTAAAAGAAGRAGGGDAQGGGVGDGAASASGAAGGYEQVSDSIVQYQRNVGLLEKMARDVGTKNDTSVTQTQYNLQLDVVTQLGRRIEEKLRAHESRLSSLPRSEASNLRATHVKLSRDYRLVEQRFRNVQLDVQRRRGMAEARRREAARAEEEDRERLRRGAEGVGGAGGGEDQTEEAMRWQMQMQEDKINEEIMREREEEIRNIHKGMHTVNEIYKDLAHLVDEQQEGVDQIETQMENTKENTASGLKHIEKANEASQSQCIIS